MSGSSKGTVWSMVAVALTALVIMPAAMGGIAVLAVSGSLGIAFGGCHGDGGPGGGGQQVGDQQWSGEQMTNAQTITSVVQQRHLPKPAAVLAISTAIVESRLINVHYGDRDSLGLFQQRPSMGWGSPEDVTNPVYATGKFLDHLVELEGWHTMPPGVAQQKVQASAFPDRYAPQEQPASQLMDKFWTGPDNPVPPPSGGDTAQQASASQSALGCPDQGGSNIPLDPAKLPPGFQLPSGPKQRAAVEFALSKLGAPYVWGAKGPDAFDCSGLMQAAWARAGVPISAGTYGQKDDGRAVGSLAEIQPGDLVFIPGSLGSPADPRHVGMYAGHGVIVNAYDSSTGVILERLDAWAPQVVSIRRIAELTTPPPPHGSPQA
ncbi:C40 family peptidase [Saccharopolyspora mangrovi]|uniref:C40 family peptidase n=1 Tax=Saccharopolyspora mangrovi TaxID=3082379 RepID=A0ABU6AIL7_9PSEU|nr:C40 family peptidase [Saccharopolyspora sp. S2-29]MEB3371312.1 C40 family peptidase [Saccharopolyspora sp. S2-29]